MRKIISIAAALMLSACSTNYGMYKKGDEEHGQYGYVSTYLAPRRQRSSSWCSRRWRRIAAAIVAAAVTARLTFSRHLATPVGLEPTTSRLEVSRSIQLSYGA